MLASEEDIDRAWRRCGDVHAMKRTRRDRVEQCAIAMSSSSPRDCVHPSPCDVMCAHLLICCDGILCAIELKQRGTETVVSLGVGWIDKDRLTTDGRR